MTEEETVERFIQHYNFNLELWLKIAPKGGLKSRHLSQWFKEHGEPTRSEIENDMPHLADQFSNPFEGAFH